MSKELSSRRRLAVLVMLICGLAAAHTATALEDIQFMQRSAKGHVLGFSSDGVSVVGGDHMLKMEFGSARNVAPISSRPPSSDSRAQPLGEVTYPDVWNGISVIYEQPAGGIVKSTYHLVPGADADQIRLRYNVPIQLDSAGRLWFEFETGQMSESAPVAWQVIAEQRVPVEVSFSLISESEVAFALEEYDPAYPLVIDPTLTWNTFLGSSNNDYGNGIAVDSSGNVYVTGDSSATWGSSPVGSHSGSVDAFVAKLSNSGGLLWNTFLGSSSNDYGNGIAVDSSGNVYVTGQSNATWGSSPVDSHSGSVDAFVAKLSNSGGLLWNTFLGSSSNDYGNGIAVDSSGNVYVTGDSFATWENPVDGHAGGGTDAFVAKLDSNGGLTWNTFFGTSGTDFGLGIAVDTSGNVYVAGAKLVVVVVGAPNRIQPKAWWPVVAAESTAFASKLDSSGGLLWDTDLGGPLINGQGSSIAVDASGYVYVAGWSSASWGNPVNGHVGNLDAFAAKLSSSGGLIWNTFLLGTSIADYGNGIAVDASGYVYVTGATQVETANVTRIQPKFILGSSKAFVARLDTYGDLLWDAILGGLLGVDGSQSIAVDAHGQAYVTGWSSASSFSPKTDTNGPSVEFDAFVTAIRFATCGDVDGDGKIDVLDVRLCHQIALGVIVGTPSQRQAADVDGDGDVDLTDAEILAKYVARIRPALLGGES